ncbi:MAG: hypothetical protein EU541_00025 [Promethearchaeota archaeon]|nr:MAG: hypothetical protein EU541_00025 [Candidatus Lokiarchaeota archaeon]
MSYFLIVFTALFISKLFLILVNLVYEPREGIFKRKKSNKDYYFWSLRAVIKKWPIWLANLIPSSVLTNLLLTVFGIKTSFSNSINNANIDTEFIEIGRDTIIGKGSFIKSSMIFKEYLIIRKIVIEDGVIIAPHSYVSPGTVIKENATLNTLSVTKLNDILHKDSIYSGYPAEKIGINSEKKEIIIEDYMEILVDKSTKSSYSKLIEKENDSNKSSEPKFVKNFPLYLGLFAFIYFFSYSLPIFCFILFFKEFFIPYVIVRTFYSHLTALILILTPTIFLSLYGFNIILTVFITKLCYHIICNLNEPREGVYHWSDKSKEYNFYFLRSFLLRYAKWKVQRGPFPWLIKWIFNFIGSCTIGKNCVIEDLYLSKEFNEIGNNVYMGKILLTNQLWDRELTVKGVHIGDNVVISDGCCIAPGNILEENITILPFSLTSKGTHLSSNNVYYDDPIKKVQNEEELVELLNLKVDLNNE